MNTLSARKVLWPWLLGCCLVLFLAGCAPRIYETPYIPPPQPPRAAPPPEVQRQVFYVAATRLNLRGCAGMDCPKISLLEQNEAVEKIGEMDDWCEVIVKRDGSRGWVSSRHLSTEPVTPAVEAPPPPVVAPPPPPQVAPAPPPVEKPPPAKPPVTEKPKPAKPGEPPALPKKKPEEPKPAEPTPKPAPPVVKPAPPEKPAPPQEPEPEQPKKIRIM